MDILSCVRVYLFDVEISVLLYGDILQGLLHLGHALPGEHTLVHDAGPAEQEDIAGDRVLRQGPAHRDYVTGDQLVRGQRAPPFTPVHLEVRTVADGQYCGSGSDTD